MTLNTDVEGRRKKKRMFVITRRIKGFPAPLGTRLHHWALVAGDTLWELDTDGEGLPFAVPNLKSQMACLKSRPVLPEDLKQEKDLEEIEAWTCYSNEQIQDLAQSMIKDWGAYNCFSANCQHFAKKLYYRIRSVEKEDD